MAWVCGTAAALTIGASVLAVWVGLAAWWEQLGGDQP